MSPTKILIIGGGAGGLELATQLGNKLGKKRKALIKLVDANHTHLWKPLLHEVATGSMDSGIDELSYRAHAHNHHFSFHIGRMCSLDRELKTISLEAINDDTDVEVLPKRELGYDILVMALGGVTNDFGTKGAAQHCSVLDSREQAETFHKKLLNNYLKTNAQAAQSSDAQLNIAIVGAGATGVELSAELHNTAEVLANYGLDNLTQDQIKISLIEAGAQILPALPSRISAAAHFELEKLGINVKTQTQIVEVTDKGFITKSGELIEASLRVWAAGVKAPDFLANIAGLETARGNQLIVKDSLQTTLDEHIFAIGDCSQFIQANGNPVPPRAQAAHQQASHTLKNIIALLNNRPLKPYVYKDHGSLVSLSRYSTVGSLMGNLTGATMMVEGKIARFVYISLYRMHQVALHGYLRTTLMSLVGRINKVIRPRLKLH
jgi:NADH dehydrogenase